MDAGLHDAAVRMARMIAQRSVAESYADERRAFARLHQPKRFASKAAWICHRDGFEAGLRHAEALAAWGISIEQTRIARDSEKTAG